MTGHPQSNHEAFAESLAAYALDALGTPAAREALEAHLAECPVCRQELSRERAVVEALGRGLEPVAPPPALRERVLAAARAGSASTGAMHSRRPSDRMAASQPAPSITQSTSSWSLAWLATAASVIIAAGSLLYAFTLQREVAVLTDLASNASARAEALNAEVVALRRQSSELVQVLNVIGAPDVLQASLSGQGVAAGSIGRAYWSRSQGLVFRALQLPGLAAGRDYQLWIVPPAGAPVSMGVLQVRADGSSSHTAPLADLPAAAAVAVTIEPAGGSAAPTMPIVMVGNLVG